MPVPSPSPLGPPERGQTMLAFGGLGHQVRPGPRPVATTFRSMPQGACMRGGLQAQEILWSFASSRSNKPAEPEEGETRGRRAFTRELKLAGVRYSELYIPDDEPKAGQLISIYRAAKDSGISEHMLCDWRVKSENILHQKKLSCRNIPKRNYQGRKDEMEKRLFVIFKEARERWQRYQTELVYEACSGDLLRAIPRALPPY